MKALTNLRFGREPEKEAEEQRVVQLFRNRAELKKAYASLQDEIHRLQDRLKQQEGATARVQEQLGDLESRLGVAETAYPAVVFYQLRHLWNTGAELLRAYGDDLQKQHLERERRSFLAELNRQQFERRQLAEGALRSAEIEASDAAQHLQRLERALRELTRPWHHFKRRALAEQVANAAALRMLAESRLEQARADFNAATSEAETPFPGLSLEARRSVNLALVAYAEYLCHRLTRTPLLALARTAMLRRDPADDYGERSQCEALMGDIAGARSLLLHRVDITAELRSRGEQMRRSACYRAEGDAIPVPESAAMTPPVAVAATRNVKAVPLPSIPNVLAEDTWDIFRVLLR